MSLKSTSPVTSAVARRAPCEGKPAPMPQVRLFGMLASTDFPRTVTPPYPDNSTILLTSLLKSAHTPLHRVMHLHPPDMHA